MDEEILKAEIYFIKKMNTEKSKVDGMLLADLWDFIRSAHSWISFTPDVRATQYVREYSELLQSDLDSLGENQGNYKEKFITHFRAWINAKSNCASSAITGGSGFNVRRAEKANNREHARRNDFFMFREKYFKSVNRQRTLSPEEELDLALEKFDRLSNLQELMKSSNALVRKMDFKELSKDEIEQQITHVMNKEDYPEDFIKELLSFNRYGYIFPSFRLTNNNAKVKGALQKVETMKRRIETKENFEDIKFSGGYITIADDRVKIFHDEKPSQDIIQKLKSNGFRWSPFWKCWCRKHTAVAIQVAKQVIQ